MSANGFGFGLASSFRSVAPRGATFNPSWHLAAVPPSDLVLEKPMAARRLAEPDRVCGGLRVIALAGGETGIFVRGILESPAGQGFRGGFTEMAWSFLRTRIESRTSRLTLELA